jgi:large conductance mechanosensitive channel
MPVVGAIFGKLDFQQPVHRAGTVPAGTADDAGRAKKAAGVPVFAYGNFITVAVNFAILAFIIFLMVKQINRLKREAPPAPAAAPAATPEDVVLLREIRDSAQEVSCGAPRRSGGHVARAAGSATPRPATRDVERGAVVGTGAHHGKAQRHVHAVLQPEVLDRDQALVVVHRDHRVKLAWPALPRACMNTVSGGCGPLASMPCRPGRSHGWRNVLDLFPPKQPPSPA